MSKSKKKKDGSDVQEQIRTIQEKPAAAAVEDHDDQVLPEFDGDEDVKVAAEDVIKDLLFINKFIFFLVSETCHGLKNVPPSRFFHFYFLI